MKGDFSRLPFEPRHNFNGVLPQQGKVLLDSDGIDQTLIENNWRETAARDWVGSLAGVPAAEPGSFMIRSATLLSDGTGVQLSVGNGRIWADGLLVRLDDGQRGGQQRKATWLEPPLVTQSGSVSTVADGTRDAVVLDVWQQTVNGFQMPQQLLEPALGGPDTAERLQTAYAFRMVRLDADQTCADLSYDESNRGSLTVSLQQPQTTAGDCPVTGSGGYSGFEHQLYRIEVANTSGATSQFKWSRMNGGLVGRGSFDPSTQAVTITANLPAITGVNQASFYLEIEALDDQLGYWTVVCGAQATLSNGMLQLPATPAYGAYPTTKTTVFFRLWDGISAVTAFPDSASPTELESGILLQFDPDGAGVYSPGDYWTFPVRAQGIANPQTLINHKPPQGILYYRVPLAEITWATNNSGSFLPSSIEDCRTTILPLSMTQGCCTCRVGDGVSSFGEFTSIQAAIDSLLPESGGEVCILPGRYFENVRINGYRDIVIHGCGWQTRLASTSLGPQDAVNIERMKAIEIMTKGPSYVGAVITITNSHHVKLHSFAVEADTDEVGILVDGTGQARSIDPGYSARGITAIKGVMDVGICDLVMTASTQPAIEVQHATLIHVERCRVAMKNVASHWPAIYASGTELHLRDNWIGVQDTRTAAMELPSSVSTDITSQAASKVAGLSRIYKAQTGAAVLSPPPGGRQPYNPPANISGSNVTLTGVTLGLNPGGIQIGGQSADVYISDNEVEGGRGNGITLGSYMELDTTGKQAGGWTGITTGSDTGCTDCTGSLQTPNPTTTGGRIVSGGLLRNIHIFHNRIRNVGMCGIGPVGFFNLLTELEIISIEGLIITDNELSYTLQRELADIAENQNLLRGYGAICVPDVVDLAIRDNQIQNTGVDAKSQTCGIYVLHGEGVEISRNTILEMRDWSAASSETAVRAVDSRAGICIGMVSPTSESGSTRGTPVYLPGTPALRIQENVVRVALGPALLVYGTGPFSIADNHFATGGGIDVTGFILARTVLIFNVGTPIEFAPRTASMKRTWQQAGGNGSANRGQIQDINAFTEKRSQPFAGVSNGSVIFNDNLCQMEGRVGKEVALASVLIFTIDDLSFDGNTCWIDAAQLRTITDAFLLAPTLRANSNRFQEAVPSVLCSGITAGFLNVTSLNISTYCLFSVGLLAYGDGNLSYAQLVSAGSCGDSSISLFGQ